MALSDARKAIQISCLFVPPEVLALCLLTWVCRGPLPVGDGLDANANANARPPTW